MTPPYTALISQVPNGLISTIPALRAISTSTISDNYSVTVLGSGVSNDGYQCTFFYSGACTSPDNGATIIKPNAGTGAWVRTIPSPHVVSTQTVSASGVGENFVLLSGAGSNTLIYTFSPSYIMYGHDMMIKSLGTGQVRIQATGSDTIFPINALYAVPSITFQSSGACYHFRVGQGVYYQV